MFFNLFKKKPQNVHEIDKTNLPMHIGIIMDGNGRWAKNQGLKRGEGHIAGAKVFKKIGEYCADLGIECVTFYAFSTENWSRPQEEVDGLMDLFIDYLIDGPYIQEQKDLTLSWRGSRNQRIIKSAESMRTNSLIIEE